MGEVINLDERRSARVRAHDGGGRSPHAPVARRSLTFSFDPAAPESYLVAERVERLFGDVTWVPVADLGLPHLIGEDARRQAVAARAAALRLPLVWPETGPVSDRATRVATLAAEHGVLPAFALAAGRLAYCGGFDLGDPEILAEAAAAAGLGLEESLRAAADVSRDAEPRRRAAELVARGAQQLPCFEVGPVLLAGEARLPEALAAVRAPISVPRPRAL